MKVVTNQVVITLDGNDVIKAVEDHLNKIYPNLRVKSIEPAMGLRNALECSALCELKSGADIKLKPIEREIDNRLKPIGRQHDNQLTSLFSNSTASKEETFAENQAAYKHHQSAATPKIPAKSFTRNNYGIGAFLGEYFKSDGRLYGSTAYTVFAFARPKFPKLSLTELATYLDRADYQKRYNFKGVMGGGKGWPENDSRAKLMYYQTTLNQ
jgi:hypothetical protein